MRRSGFVLCVLLLGASHPAEAADEPRALIERALKAMGGAEAVKQQVAVRSKFNGKSHVRGQGEALSFQGEAWEVGQRCKLSYQTDIAGSKIAVTVVFDDDNSWFVTNGQFLAFDKDQIEQQRNARHVDRVRDLVDLLTDKGFALTPLADLKVDGRAAAGLKVSYKGRPDTNLYFDKETGLLAKYAFRTKRFLDKKEGLLEMILSDYREPNLASADEKILRAAQVDTAGPALVAFVRQQTPDKAALDRVRTLIDKLGDGTFQVRKQASRDLVAAGSIAIPLLREATKNKDAEVVRRARECLQRIGERSGKAQVSAAVRLLALRRPKGAAEALLNYLSAADANVSDEVRAALFNIAHVEGKRDPLLVRALRDKDQRRRAAAAAALGEDGGDYARRPGRRVIPRPFKIATKAVRYVDGKKEAEIEHSEFQFFNAFEDKVFAKP